MVNLVIASGNENKVREYRELLKDFPFIITSLKDENIILDVDENGTTFLENSLIKARYIASKVHKLVIADDSGLCVHALNNFPGIYSARFMEGKSYIEKNQAIVEMLKEHQDKSAHFTCSIVLIDKYGEHCFEDICEGTIVDEKEDKFGFGYDPIFLPKGQNKTFGALEEHKKNQISHRGKATKKLIEYLNKIYKKS